MSHEVPIDEMADKENLCLTSEEDVPGNKSHGNQLASQPRNLLPYKYNCGKTFQYRSDLQKHFLTIKYQYASVDNAQFDPVWSVPQGGYEAWIQQGFRPLPPPIFTHNGEIGPQVYSRDSMLDQPAYVTFLVDEALKECEIPNRPPAVSQSVSSLAPHCQYTNYINPQVGDSFTRPTGVLSSYPEVSHPFNNQGFQAPLGPSGQGFLHGIAPEFSTFPGTQAYFRSQESHIDVNLPTNQTSSFRLDQHIGLNESSVVNASQLNNKIQVQYRFTDSDRFSVQSSYPASSDGPNVNLYRGNIPDNLVHTAKGDSNTRVQSEINQTPSTFNPGLNPRYDTEFNQFCVASFIGRNPVGTTNDKNGNISLENESSDCQAQANERDAFKVFMLTDRCTDEEKLAQNSQTGYVQRGRKRKPAILKKTQKRISNKTVSTSTDIDCFAKPQIVSKARNRFTSNGNFQREGNKSHYIINRTELATQIVCVESSDESDSSPDFHAASKAYFKEFTELVKKQKAEKAASRSEVLKETVSLTYQCEYCSKTYRNIEKLKKHIYTKHTIRKNKSNKNKKNKKSDTSTCKDTGERKMYCENAERNMDCENGELKVDCENAKQTTDCENVELKVDCENGEHGTDCENESVEVMDTETENIVSEIQSYLCCHCGYDSKTLAESNEHLQTHKEDEETEMSEGGNHLQEREYLQMSKELEEKRKKEKETIGAIAEMEQALLQDTSEEKSNEGVALPTPQVGKPTENPLQQEQRNVYRRRAATQAKNNLMNPSKGKQKKVRNLNKKDGLLLETFDICPSKVHLNRVQETGDTSTKNERSPDDKGFYMEENKNPVNSGLKKKSGRRNKTLNDWNKVINMSNNAKESEELSDTQMFSDDDSDIEIVEPPKTVIVLDDDISVPAKGSPSKSDKEIMKSFGIKDVSVQLDKTDKISEVLSSKSKCESDTEALQRHQIKTLSVGHCCPSTKQKKLRPGPKSKRLRGKIQATGSTSANVHEFENMSPKEIERMLSECGMGISVPNPAMDLKGKGECERTPSPVPSTSKGHGNLKRKRTARKSAKDSALFEKYNLKDSKVILKSLSGIDLSLLRNPNSPFGKNDWLKHKFDSDTESDFDFDISTPPVGDDFIDTSIASRGERKGHDHSLKPDRNGRSRERKQDLKMLEKFGIHESKVIIDSPKKMEAQVSSQNPRKKTLSDEELRKKFGIPNTVVVVTTSEKGSGNKKEKETEGKGKSKNVISFEDFRSALDSARKNILSKLKSDQDPVRTGAEIIDTKQDITCTDVRTKARRKICVADDESVVSPKRQKLERIEKSSKRTELRSGSENKDKKSIIQKRQTHVQQIHATNSISYSGNSNVKNIKKTLPFRLKTLSVTLKRLKMNEALKTYKAKSVSRAIRTNKNRNITDKNDQIKSEQNNLPLGQRTLRHRKSYESLEKSLKRKTITARAKENIENNEKKMDTQVVKTARYRRSFAKSVQDHGDTDKNKLEIANNSLVKETAPYSSYEETVHFSQTSNLSNEATVLKEKEESEKISEEIVREIVDKICSEELPSDNCSLLSEDIQESSKKNVQLSQKSVDGDHCMDNGQKEITHEEKYLDDDTTTEKRNICEQVSVEGTESDVSLISVMSENNENEIVTGVRKSHNDK